MSTFPPGDHIAHRPVAPSPFAPAAWLFLAAAGVFVVLLAGHYLSLVIRHIVLGLQVTAVGLLGTWLAMCVITPRARIRTPLMLPVALASGAYVISALLSQRPRLSAESTLGGLAFAIAFFLVVRLLAQPWFRARAATLFITVSVSIAALYVLQVVVSWVQFWSVVGRVVTPPLRPYWAGLVFGSPNVLASFLLLTGPLTVALLWLRGGRRVIAASVVVLFGVGVVLTGSRGALIGVAAGVAASVAFGAAGGGSDVVRQTWHAHRRRWLITGTACVVVAAVLLPSVIYRFGTGGDTVRLDLWRSAFTVFGEHPITGGGPGTWVQLKVAANPPGVANNIFNNAHNMYIQAAAELGVLGLLAMGVLAFAFLRRLLRAVAASGPLRWQAIGVAGSLAALGGQLLVENMIRLPSICLLIVFLVAWVEAGLLLESPRAPHVVQSASRRTLAQLLPAAGLVVLLAAVPLLLRLDLAAGNAEAGDHAMKAGDWELALANYDAAVAGDPGFTLYEIQRASALARVGRTAEARDALSAALETDPTAINQIGMAVLEAELGNNAAAADHARRALSFGFGEATVALNAGLVGERIGDSGLALEGFSLALASGPALAGETFWTMPERVVGKDEVIARARSLVSPLRAALITAYAGDPAGARVELLALPASEDRTIYLAVVDWLAGNAERAVDALEAMVEADPLNWTAAAWAARIARLSGDVVRAARFTEWAVAIQGDTAPSVIFKKAIVGPGESGSEYAGIPKGYPSAMYLRAVSPYLLMPQLIPVGTR